MLSVTQRLESVSQPFGGYVPKKLFVEKQYDDGIYVPEVGAEFAPTQGMVICRKGHFSTCQRYEREQEKWGSQSGKENVLA